MFNNLVYEADAPGLGCMHSLFLILIITSFLIYLKYHIQYINQHWLQYNISYIPLNSDPNY